MVSVAVDSDAKAKGDDEEEPHGDAFRSSFTGHFQLEGKRTATWAGVWLAVCRSLQTGYLAACCKRLEGKDDDHHHAEHDDDDDHDDEEDDLLLD